MNNQQSFSSSLNFNKSLSIEDSSQNFSSQNQKIQEALNLQQNGLTFQNEHFSQPPLLETRSRTLPQETRNQHFKDDFDAVDQSDFQKFKNNSPEHSNRTDNKLNPSNSLINRNSFRIDQLFERLKSSNGDNNVFYQYHQNNEEEGRIILQSLQEELAKPLNVTETADSQNRFEFSHFQEFNMDLKNHTTFEVLGQGLHGLVIKLVNYDGFKYNAIKLYRKKDKKAFIGETIILSNIKKARRLGLFWDSPFNAGSLFHHRDFETNEYYGLFIQEGPGSLGDFQEYLKEGEIKLSQQELIVFSWALLDNCYCLHQINYCHRDIKPANIIINPDSFLPELIDYSLASKFSEAKKGNYGTPGYRLEDFEDMKDNKETKWQDHLKSNDYFAIGKTMLEIAFPRVRMRVRDIPSQLEKLKKSGMKIIAEILEICLFGDIQSKENILEEYAKSGQFSFKDRLDENKFQESEKIQRNFDSESVFQLTRLLREKYCDNFKAFMKEKLKKKQANEGSRLKEISHSIISKEPQNQKTTATSKAKMFDKEEQWIQENFKKAPEQAVKKCKDVMDQLVRASHPILDSKLLSTLIAVLYLNGCIDDAVNLCEEILLLDTKSQDYHWAVLNNAAIVYFAANLKKPLKSLLDKFRDTLQRFQFWKSLFIQELESVFYPTSAHVTMHANKYIQHKSGSSDEQFLILTFFTMKEGLLQLSSFWNYGYVISSHLDSIIDETVRSSMKKFVSDLNLPGKKRAFDFLGFSSTQRILFTFMTFCQIFERLSADLGELNFLKTEAREIISNKTIWATELLNAKNRSQEKRVREFLLENELMYVMSGFFILYNIKENMRTKDILKEESEESKSKQKNLEEERENNIKEYEAKMSKEKQRFLDSIMSFISEVPDTEFVYSIRPSSEKEHLHQISILGTELNDIILSQYESICVEEYNFKYSKKEKSSAIKSLHMKCITPFLEDTRNLLNISTINKLQSSEEIVLEFYNSRQNPYLFPKGEMKSLTTFEELTKFLSALELTGLKIILHSRIKLPNEEFRPLSKFISTQTKLKVLYIIFDLSLINPDGIQLFAKDLAELQQLQRLYISFNNCPEIDSDSIFSLLLTLKKLTELKYVDLKIFACSNVTFLEKPQGLPFKIDVSIALHSPIFLI